MPTFDFKQDLLDVFNAENPHFATPLTQDDVTFGEPDWQYWNENDDEDMRDTAITITAKPECLHFKGTQTLRWQREIMKPIAPETGRPITESLADWDTTEKIDARVRQEYAAVGGDLDLLDFVGYDIDVYDGVLANDGYDKDVTVTTRDSLRYGATVLVEWQITNSTP
ncbi:hypothetical protein PHOBOS_156 [Erwinia phage vB_EamM_Phobos]|uniref:hypothetical protein n=1 Tax=Erwinia phage vB_EamM_Phobos TaxID=1883377 RepID=UPI00081C57B7|nr:hypothetical protein BIZ79_gp156 [Erwinia phage vB_EamM_Phobos]ANZ50346.1 hypothetical protein PHOBOS_156 [Erwinia phage vB_EamM_Phobos]